MHVERNQPGLRELREAVANRTWRKLPTRAALKRDVVAGLNAAISNLEAARSTEQISRTRLLPQAELTFNAALAGYENGKVDFATLLDAQRQIRNARLALLRAQASQQMRLADIERLLGEDL